MRLHFINQLQIMRYQFLSKRCWWCRCCCCCCCPTVGDTGRGLAWPMGTVGCWGVGVASLPPTALLIECKYSFTCCTHSVTLTTHSTHSLSSLSLRTSSVLSCCPCLAYAQTDLCSFSVFFCGLLHIFLGDEFVLSLCRWLVLSVCCCWPKWKEEFVELY